MIGIGIRSVDHKYYDRENFIWSASHLPITHQKNATKIKNHITDITRILYRISYHFFNNITIKLISRLTPSKINAWRGAIVILIVI